MGEILLPGDTGFFDPDDPNDWLKTAPTEAPLPTAFPTEPIGGALITSAWGQFIQDGLQVLKPLIAHCTGALNNPGVSPGQDIPGMSTSIVLERAARLLVVFWVGFQQTAPGAGYIRAALQSNTNGGAWGSFGGSIMYGPGSAAGTFRGTAIGIEYTDASPSTKGFKAMAFQDVAGGTVQIYDGALVVLPFLI